MAIIETYIFFFEPQSSKVFIYKIYSFIGNDLAVKWLGLHVFTAGSQVWSQVEELRSCKPYETAKNKKLQFLRNSFALCK